MACYHLDITQDHCPMTFVKVKIALSKMQRGDTLEVRLVAGEALRNIPRNVRRLGYEVSETQYAGDSVYKILIGGGPPL